MNIYVSNLNSCTSEKDLKGMFSEFGVVTSVKIIIVRETTGQHGSALINMPSDVEAKAALIGMNNKEVEGNTLFVSATKHRLHSSLLPRPNRLF